MLLFTKSLHKYLFAVSKFNTYKDVILTNAELTKSFMRSSGPGGQSVNTTNSKAEVRLLISQCSAVDSIISDNLYKKYGTFINKTG